MQQETVYKGRNVKRGLIGENLTSSNIIKRSKSKLGIFPFIIEGKQNRMAEKAAIFLQNEWNGSRGPKAQSSKE